MMCQPFWRERRDLPRPVRWMNGRDSDGSMAGVDGQGRFPGSVTCSIRRGCSPKLLQKSWLFLVFFDYVFFLGGVGFVVFFVCLIFLVGICFCLLWPQWEKKKKRPLNRCCAGRVEEGAMASGFLAARAMGIVLGSG